MKLIYKVLIIFYCLVIIGIVAWVFISIQKPTEEKKYSYKLFDSTFYIKTPFYLTDDSIARFAKKNFLLDTVFARSYMGRDIEIDIQCWKFIREIPGKNKKELLTDWLTDMDSSFRSVSRLKQEKLVTIQGQKFEYYDGVIDYLQGYAPTNLRHRFFTTLITLKKRYCYFIDIRYNESDKTTLVKRDKIFNSIIIR